VTEKMSKTKKITLLFISFLIVLGVFYAVNLYKISNLTAENCLHRGGEIVTLKDQINSPIVGEILGNIKGTQDGSLCVRGKGV